jgi:hypothetical protein
MHTSFMPREVTVKCAGGDRTFRIVYEFAPVGYQHGANGLTAPTGAVLTGAWIAYPQRSGDPLVEGVGFFAHQITAVIEAALPATEAVAA